MANKNFPNPFGKLLTDYQRMRKGLPRQVSIIAAKHFTDNFRRQGYLNNGTVIAWKPRKLQRYSKRGQKSAKSSRLKLTQGGKADRGRAILVQSGRLRRAIRPSSSGDYAVVKNDTPYAGYLNDGTDKMPARPFMITTPDLEKEIEEHFFNEIDKMWK
jgi:HK97 gp10 family phage protein